MTTPTTPHVPADGTPWHLMPEEMREYFYRQIGHAYDHPSRNRIGGFAAKARAAAIAVLRDAAPYPDEALVFAAADESYGHLQLVGIGYDDGNDDPMPDTWVMEDDDGAEMPFHPNELRALTIAAHEALEMFAVRSRTP